MHDVIKLLEENPVQYFATIGLDGKPKVRPFQFMHEEDSKLYFCTSNQKEVFKEMSKSPYIELSVSTTDYKWIRLKGKVVFSDDMKIKKAIVEKSEIVKMVYKTAENPDFEIFYLEDAKAILADFSGNEPREVRL
ncbi:MAG: pyridoxamine 5'-phosphate oxidase family protein [Firmicutes bacterium]|jgi:uncharacterized pyridoxamine 5'-phosphate oxidase family protein|nr:pyridoxamine 5'-phosphate oxidase family protein [Bacillota bacterium]